jgi:hypothetical protein
MQVLLNLLLVFGMASVNDKACLSGVRGEIHAAALLHKPYGVMYDAICANKHSHTTTYYDSSLMPYDAIHANKQPHTTTHLSFHNFN